MDENDLRGALAVLADRAFDPASAAAQADREFGAIRVRRRRYALTGAAAAVVVVAGTSGVLTGLNRSSPTPATGPTASTPVTQSSAPVTSPTPQPPAVSYRWTVEGAAPQLPVTVKVPAGYTKRAIKFYPPMRYTIIGYSSPDPDRTPFSVAVGDAEAFSTAEPSPTRPAITGPSGQPMFLDVTSSDADLERQIAAGVTDAPSTIDLGLSVQAIPQGGYIAAARVDPGDPTALAAVDVAVPISTEIGQTSLVTLTLRDAAGLGPVAATVTLTSPAGRVVTVDVGTDTTSWILLGDGNAIVLNGYPLSGAMLRNVKAYPQSSLLPLLAGTTAADHGWRNGNR